MKFDYIQDGTGFGTPISCENGQNFCDDAISESLLNSWRVRYGVFGEASGAAAGAPARTCCRRGGSTAGRAPRPTVLNDSIDDSKLFFGVPYDAFGSSGGHSNTPCSNRHTPELETFRGFDTPRDLPSPDQFQDVTCIVDPYACFAGFDGGCRVSYSGAWDWAKWERLSERLTALQAEHNERRAPVIAHLFDGDDSTTWSFRGAGRGEIHTFGDQNNGLRWCLERGGVRLYINADVDKPPHAGPDAFGYAPVGQIAIGVIFGERLFRGGVSLFPIAEMVRSMIGELGFLVRSERVHRIDFQVTTDRISVSELREFERVGRVCSRSDLNNDIKPKKRGVAPSDGTLYWGTSAGKVRLRVYDKLAEAQANKKEDGGDKFGFLLNSLGNDWLIEGRSLTRFEFELRRGILRDFEVETLDDLRRALPSIVDYLVDDWFRILGDDFENSKKHGNTRRVETLETWAIIASVFSSYARAFCSSEGPVLRVTRRKRERTGDALPDVRASEDFSARADAVYLMSLGYGIDEGRDVRELDLAGYLAIKAELFENRRDSIIRYIARKGGGFPRHRSFYDFSSATD